MRATEFITEARRNPDQNPKVSPVERIKIRVAQAPRNTFVSMTAIDKLGINPNSEYDTPLGIYSYPAEYVAKEGARSLADLPFAGASPYANIFNGRGNIVDVGLMTDAELSTWIHKLSDYFAGLWKQKMASKYAGDANAAWKAGADIVNYVIEQSAEMATFGRKPGGRFWYITMHLADQMKKEARVGGSRPSAWNALFRAVGIDGCMDSTGVGIIHTAERTQAVFFHTGAIANLERVDNKWDRDSIDDGEDKRVTSESRGVVRKFLTQRPDLAATFVHEAVNKHNIPPDERVVISTITTEIQLLLAKLGLGANRNAVGIVENLLNPNIVWLIVSSVKTTSNAQKQSALLTQLRASNSSSNFKRFVNEFAQPAFINHITVELQSDRMSATEKGNILAAMSESRVVTSDLYRKLLETDTIPAWALERAPEYIAFNENDVNSIVDYVIANAEQTEPDGLESLPKNEQFKFDLVTAMPINDSQALRLFLTGYEELIHLVSAKDGGSPPIIAAMLLSLANHNRRHGKAGSPAANAGYAAILKKAPKQWQTVKLLRSVAEALPQYAKMYDFIESQAE